jgi:hypothetical protein
LDEAAPLHQAMGIIRRDLQGALPPGPGNLPMAGDFKSESVGEGISSADTLSLFTTTGALSDNSAFSEIQEVVYELKDPAQHTTGPGRDLVRSVYRNILATGQPIADEQMLMGNVQSLEFSCYDGSNWRDSWNTSLSDTNLPSAVRVRIQIANDSGSASVNQQPFEIVVPVVSQSRTNQLASASSTGG